MGLNYTTILMAPPSCLKSPYQCPQSIYIPYLKGELTLYNASITAMTNLQDYVFLRLGFN